MGPFGTRRLFLVAFLFVLATPAHAAVVSLREEHDLSELRFRARPGEVNVVTLTYTFARGGRRSGETTIRELGAPLQPGRGCRAIAAATVRCVRRCCFWADEIALGDGADVARFTGRPRRIDLSLSVFADAGAQRVSLEALTPRPLLLGFIVSTGAGDDTISGSPRRDELDGGAGHDTIRGGAGNDAIQGEDGDDLLDGGPGRDEADFNGAPRGIVANLATGTAVGWGEDRLRDVESLTGSFLADSLTGDANRNELFGLSGRDRLVGEAGNDYLDGGPRADHLVGGAGRDGLDGGLGLDRVVGGAGADRLDGDYFGSSLGGADHLLGGAGRDRLFGGVGGDRLAGGAGGDRLVGDYRGLPPGADRFVGGADNDTLIARDGRRDRLDGGRGSDRACVDRRRDRIRRVETLACRRVSGVRLTGREARRIPFGALR